FQPDRIQPPAASVCARPVPPRRHGQPVSAAVHLQHGTPRGAQVLSRDRGFQRGFQKQSTETVMNRIWIHLVGAAIGLAALPASAALNIFACEPEWGALAKELAGEK